MKKIPFIVSLMASSALAAQPMPCTIDEARQLMLQHSPALKASAAQVEMAQRERSRVAALWWPHLQAEGMYVHMSEDIEVRQPLSYYTDPLKEQVQSLMPGEELLTDLIDKVGEYTLSLPLLPQDVASVGLTAEWVAFSGGKRYYAGKMALHMAEIAKVEAHNVEAAQEVLLVERYYGLLVAQQSTEVHRQRFEAMKRHHADALRMEQVGLTDKAARLATGVALAEAERQWHHAQSIEQLRLEALQTLLGINPADSIAILPTSPLFISTEIPSEALFVEAMHRGNRTLSTLSIEQQMAADNLRMGFGGYLPEVTLFGKQTLYAHGLPSNLFPRTVVGVGFAWNLFDGLDREHKLSQDKLLQQSLAWSRADAEAELTIAVAELYTALQDAVADTHTLSATIALNEELLRMRRTAFAQGMATATELVDAEDALATSRLAHLASQYAAKVTMANLQALCGEL